MKHGKHAKRRHVSRRLVKTSITAGLMGLLATTAVQLPASPVQAEVASSGLTRFLVPDGRSRFADEITGLVNDASARGYQVDIDDVNVYAVPTVEGVSYYITRHPESFRVVQNIARTIAVPGGDPTEYLGVGEVVDSVNGHLIVYIAPSETRRLLEEAGDPEVLAGEVFEVVPMANASLPINTYGPKSFPMYQAVDGAAAGSTPTGGNVTDVDAPTSLSGSTPSGGVVQGEDDLVNGANSSGDSEVLRDPEETEASWKRNNDDCFAVSNNAWLRRVCWTVDNQINDESDYNSFWQFRMEAASYPKQKRGMYHTWVEGKPRVDGANGAQKFDGRLPEPYAEVGGTDNCADLSHGLTISGGKPIQVGINYNYSYKSCETYTPKAYEDDGHWSNKWHFNPDRDEDGVGYGDGSATHMRYVAFNMTVKTAYDKLVSWWLYSGTEVTKKYCC